MRFTPTNVLTKKAGTFLMYFAGFFLLAAVMNWVQAPKTSNLPPFKELKLTTLSGEPMNLRVDTGKKTILYFFAPWCSVCKVSIDAMNMFAGKENINAYAIGLDYENLSELSVYQKDLHVKVLAGDASLQKMFQADRYPTVYILDEKGNVKHVMVGYASRLGIFIRTLF